ncbi:MAG: sigma-70 family RNA polymerase sigma factor [Lachnospiraceae bacterium]|nr:sigma-70 family RNA polymerase sigma factor [Lachnospiraceae bacterium]
MSLSEEKYIIDYEKVMETYSDMVYRIIVTITGNGEDAKDAFQETFLRLVRNQHKIKDEEHLKAWLIRVSSNCAKSIVTNPWNKRTQGLDGTEEKEMFVQEESHLLSEVKSLSSKYALPLYLFYYEEYSIKEIAVILEKNENTIKTLLNRGRALLKKQLERGEG